MSFDPRPMTPYKCPIVTIALSRTETLVFSRWPWFVLPRSPKVKLIMPSDPRPMTSYKCSIVTIALSRTETLIFCRWPWSSLSKSLKVKLIIPSYSRPMTSYKCFIVIITLSRTETLFLSRWPWYDLPKSPKVKPIIPFDQQLMTSYQRSIVTIALSRFVYEIFAVKLLKTFKEIRHLTFSRSLTSTDSSSHLTPCMPFLMRFIWDMLRWYPFYHLLCTFMYSANNLGILKRALNNLAKFSKYFSILRSRNSGIPGPNEPSEGPLEWNSLLDEIAKNQLDCSISSTSYVMDNAHLCLGRRKTEQKQDTYFASKTGHLDWYSNLTFQGHPSSNWLCYPIRDQWLPIRVL